MRATSNERNPRAFLIASLMFKLNPSAIPLLIFLRASSESASATWPEPAAFPACEDGPPPGV